MTQHASKARTAAPGPPPEGLVIVDKPAGITSHDVIDQLRRALGTRKVGHAGTLDPMATGVLLVGVGRATRLLRYFGALPKVYEGTGLLGIETDTLDAEGQVTRTATEAAAALSPEALDAAVAALTGEISQVPPAYSAVKVGGVTSHKAARRGETVEAPPRLVTVSRFVVTDASALPAFDFDVTCSGGTYVRTLVADAGTALGCGAHLTRLRRTKIGPYTVEQGVSPTEPGEPLPIERAVAHLPKLELDAHEADAAAHGRPLGPADIEGPYGVYGPDKRLIGIYRDENVRARPEMILAPHG